MTGSFGIDVLLHLEDLSACWPPAAAGQTTRAGWSRSRTPAGCARNSSSVVPELGAGAPALVKVKFKRAHLEDGHWVTLHRLTVLDEGADSPREIDIRGVLLAPGIEAPAESVGSETFASAEWRAYLPDLRLVVDRQPADVGLPAMPCLIDPDAARDTLQTALRNGAPARAELTLAAADAGGGALPRGPALHDRLRARVPGRAETVGPSGVVAKVYEGDEGRHTYAAMTAMWNSPLRFSSTVRIAEPLAFLPEINVVLQELVPGDISLKDHLKQACADGVAARSGRAHRVRPQVRTWPRRAAHLRGDGRARRHLGRPDRGPAGGGDRAGHRAGGFHAPRSNRWSGGLERAAAKIPAVPLVPTHRSFRPAQILLDGTDIAFLDFDGYCRAEPGLDLSLFRTTLVDLCLRALEADDEAPSRGVAARAAGAAGQSVRELPGRLRGGRAGGPRAARPLGRPDQRQGHRGLLAQGQVRAPRPADGVPAAAVAAGVGPGAAPGAF